MKDNNINTETESTFEGIADMQCYVQDITHNEIVQFGAKWLKKHRQNLYLYNCPIVATELHCSNNTGEIVDIIGFNSSNSILIEVKVSRADFLADKKKEFRNEAHLGVGQFRYYLAPKGIIAEKDLPLNWGLLEFENNKIEIIVQAEKQGCNLESERSIMYSLLRRSCT